MDQVTPKTVTPPSRGWRNTHRSLNFAAVRKALISRPYRSFGQDSTKCLPAAAFLLIPISEGRFALVTGMMTNSIEEIRCHHFSKCHTIALVYSSAKVSEERLPCLVGQRDSRLMNRRTTTLAIRSACGDQYQCNEEQRVFHINLGEQSNVALQRRALPRYFTFSSQ